MTVLLAAFNTNRYAFVLNAMYRSPNLNVRWKAGQGIGTAVYVFMLLLLPLFSRAFIVVIVAGMRCLFIALNTD